MIQFGSTKARLLVGMAATAVILSACRTAASSPSPAAPTTAPSVAART